MRLRANALVFVIVLIAISSITLMAYNQIISNNLMRVTKSSIELEALRAHEEAHLYLRFNPIIKIAKPVPSIDDNRNLPFGKTPILTAKPWGLFNIHQVSSVLEGTHLKTLRVGGEQRKLTSFIHVAGSKWETLAEPETDIRTGVYGTLIRAKPGTHGSSGIPARLPKNQYPKKTLPIRKANWEVLEQDEFEIIDNAEAIGTVRNHDWQAPARVLLGDNIHIQYGDTIVGNVIIQAHSSITVDEGAFLTMAILKAPEIIIKDGFKGVAQLNSSRKIELSTGCALDYPSSAFMSSESNADTLQLNIRAGASFKGAIYIDEKASAWLSQIHVAKTAEITGSISTPGILDLRGTLRGSCRIGSFAKIDQGTVTNGLLAGGKVFAIEDLDIPWLYPIDREIQSDFPLNTIPVACN